MYRTPVVHVAFAAALALIAGAANAFSCYTILDRNDNVIYRDQISPIDLSERGVAARNAIRDRGEYLLILDSDRCPPIVVGFKEGSSGTNVTDEFVGGIRATVTANDAAAVMARPVYKASAPGAPTTPTVAPRGNSPGAN